MNYVVRGMVIMGNVDMNLKVIETHWAQDTVSMATCIRMEHGTAGHHFEENGDRYP